MQGFVNGDYDRVELVYNHFRNAAVQYVKTEQLLPVAKPDKKQAVKTASAIITQNRIWVDEKAPVQEASIKSCSNKKSCSISRIFLFLWFVILHCLWYARLDIRNSCSICRVRAQKFGLLLAIIALCGHPLPKS